MLTDQHLTLNQQTDDFIKIPFYDDMCIAAIDGYKGCTSRPHAYGTVGDKFYITDPRDYTKHLFVLTNLLHLSLGDVATRLYKLEGFNSPEEFIARWVLIHPTKGFVPTQRVYVHYFKPVLN